MPFGGLLFHISFGGGKIMNRMKRVKWVFSLCFALFFVWAEVVSAGVPAPAPDAVSAPEVAIANLGDFQFESGEVVKDFKVSYITHGKVNEKKDNVILAMHSMWADHRQLNFLIGPGKALDTDKYFIVATDKLGNAAVLQDITTGPTNSGLKMAFPRYTIRDEVNLEYKLLKEYLGFDHILVAIGICVGGMKAYQLGVSYPDYCSGLIPIVGTPVTNPQTRTVLRNLMDIFEVGSGWYGGEYETNPLWAVHTVAWNSVTWCYTPGWFATNLNTEEQYRQWKAMWRDIIHFYPQDARDWYYALHAWEIFNIGDTPGFNGDAKAALKSTKAPVLIIGDKGDMLVNPAESIFAKNAIPKASYVEIDTPWGHLGCIGWDPKGTEIMSREISKFLSDLPRGGH
jgi:homoserine O-acetyltransferase